MVVYSWFYEIWNAIYTSLLTLKNTDLIIGEVFNRDVKIESWMATPVIIIVPTNGKENALDSALNDVTFNFSIRLLDQTYENFDSVEENMRKIADNIIEKLKDLADITYDNWGHTYKLEFDYQRWFTDTQEPFRVFEVTAHFFASETK